MVKGKTGSTYERPAIVGQPQQSVFTFWESAINRGIRLSPQGRGCPRVEGGAVSLLLPPGSFRIRFLKACRYQICDIENSFYPRPTATNFCFAALVLQSLPDMGDLELRKM